MIDTHCHLQFTELLQDLEVVLARAKNAGVGRIIVPSTGIADSVSAVDISNHYEHVYAAVGVHPTDVAMYGEDERCRMKELLGANKNVVSIGEVGLDFYRTTKEDVEAGQEKVFREMIVLAQENSLPIIIHSRAAFAETYAILKEMAPNYPIVIHCFSGTLQEAQSWLDVGYLLSFTGMVTYKKNDELRSIVKELPLDRMMIETDAPFLAPEGHRGTTCEPWHVKYVAECIAQVRGISFEEVDRVTTNNAEVFFRLSHE